MADWFRQWIDMVDRATGAVTNPSIRWRVLLPFAIILTLYLIENERSYRWNLSEWDLLLHTGLAALVIGIGLSYGIPDRLQQTTSRLSTRGILKISSSKRDELWKRLRERAFRWASRAAVGVALAILTAWIWAYGSRLLVPEIALLATVEVIGGFIAGAHLGRLAAYGTLGSTLRHLKVRVDTDPQHPDGVAGLKPVGEFFFFQAMLAAIPAIYLSIWLILIQFAPVGFIPDYHRWVNPYWVLLPIAITFEVLAFIMPMWFFHQEMVMGKREHLDKADASTAVIADLRRRLAEPTGAVEQKELKEKLALLTQYYVDAESMATWPVDLRTRKRFAVNNLSMLLLPLLSDWLDLPNWWQQVLKSLAASQ